MGQYTQKPWNSAWPAVRDLLGFCPVIPQAPSGGLQTYRYQGQPERTQLVGVPLDAGIRGVRPQRAGSEARPRWESLVGSIVTDWGRRVPWPPLRARPTYFSSSSGPPSHTSSHAPRPTHPVTISSNLGQEASCRHLRIPYTRRSCGKPGHPWRPRSHYLQGSLFPVLSAAPKSALFCRPPGKQHETNHAHTFPCLSQVTRHVLSSVTLSMNLY